jgi:hypothetical protein
MSKQMSFDQAAQDFKDVQKKYQHYGAYDTEPDWEFQWIVRQLREGKDPIIPQNAADWQLFSDMEGNELVAQALAEAAERVVQAGKSDHLGLVRWAKANLWRC